MDLSIILMVLDNFSMVVKLVELTITHKTEWEQEMKMTPSKSKKLESQRLTNSKLSQLIMKTKERKRKDNKSLKEDSIHLMDSTITQMVPGNSLQMVLVLEESIIIIKTQKTLKLKIKLISQHWETQKLWLDRILSMDISITPIEQEHLWMDQV